VVEQESGDGSGDTEEEMESVRLVTVAVVVVVVRRFFGAGGDEEEEEGEERRPPMGWRTEVGVRSPVLRSSGCCCCCR
jgi:hypothetical protein